FIGAFVPEAKAGSGITRVAAVFGFRRLLQHDDPFGARLLCGDRSIECRAAAADDDNVVSLHLRRLRSAGPIFVKASRISTLEAGDQNGKRASPGMPRT